MRTEELLALGVFAEGSRLGERIELLLKLGREFSPRASAGRVGVSSLVLMGLVAVCSFSPRWIAFAQARPAFDAASVKHADMDHGERHYRYDPIRIDYAGAVLLFLIGEAYQMPVNRILNPDSRARDLLYSGFDVTAKSDHPVPKEQLMSMLQSLLADRFKLVAHHETKIQAIYKLVAGKNGPKLQAPADGADTRGELTISAEGLTGRGVSMAQLSIYLTGHMDRSVQDETGLTGVYDFTLKLGSQEDAPAVPKTSASGGWSTSSIFSDIQKQLGLQLTPDRGAVDYLVIDHVEKPNEN